MVNVAGVSSLVVMVKLLTVGGCGTGSLFEGEEEQVNRKKAEHVKIRNLIS
jgi:hypothetical protein|tara:strand:- start:189 stop:341 length:153 start_codon:yes stop_codon:yes gene_type:complete